MSEFVTRSEFGLVLFLDAVSAPAPESLLSADRGGAWLKARILIGRWHGQFSNGDENIAEAEKKSGNTEAGAVFPLEKQVREAISRSMLKQR